MKVGISPVALIASTLLLQAGESVAQARGPSVQERRAQRDARSGQETRGQDIAALDAWLRRLVGEFRVTRTVTGSPLMEPCAGAEPGRCNLLDQGGRGQSTPPLARETVEGMARCHAIGTGAGVSCRLDTNRAESRWSTIRLFGVDLEGPGIRLMQVEGVGTAAMATGRLDRDVVSFELPCPAVQDAPFCTSVMRVSAPPRSQRIEITLTEVWRPGPDVPGRPRGERIGATLLFELQRQQSGVNTGQLR